jgi:hypothetical protein
MLTLLATSGCAVHRVRADFTGFEKAYADTSNRELLLNLARLQNHDPTYFFKMGQITSSYRMSATAPTSIGFASQSTIANKSNTTGGATPGLSYESDPLFQFIPVNDETNAQLLLKPIPAETFYILYQQGWRIDQLFRVMVDRIEVTHHETTGCSVKIFRNVPPTVGAHTAKFDDQDKIRNEELSSYAGFLRASAIAYALQRHGNLALREVSTFVALDTKAFPTAPSTAPKLDTVGGSKPEPATPPDPSQTGISASDIEKAAEKGLSFESYAFAKTKGDVLIGQRIDSPKFYLIPTTIPGSSPDMMATIQSELTNDPLLGVLKNEKAPLAAISIFLNAVQNGFAIEDDVVKPALNGGPCPIDNQDTSQNPYSARLVLRSLIGVMAAVAQEQESLYRLVRNDTQVSKLVEEPTPLGFSKAIPEIELLPVLQINWKADDEVNPGPRTKSLIELNYRDMEYLIADPVSEAASVPENEYWNRDVFRLIAALTAQVTVDTSKYPIANILQLNSVQ